MPVLHVGYLWKIHRMGSPSPHIGIFSPKASSIWFAANVVLERRQTGLGSPSKAVVCKDCDPVSYAPDGQ